MDEVKGRRRQGRKGRRTRDHNTGGKGRWERGGREREVGKRREGKGGGKEEGGKGRWERGGRER